MEGLNWLNLLMLPVVYYLIRVEHRLTKLETKVETLLRMNCEGKG